MLDIAVSYNRYQFLGNEFLTWLWYIIENDREKLVNNKGHRISLMIGNKIVFQNRLSDDSCEVISIKGDDADLKEGIIALRKGAVVTELNLIFQENEFEWKFNVKGENFHITGLKTPENGKIEKIEDIDGFVLEKVHLYNTAMEIMASMYRQFILLRLSDEWRNSVIHNISGWILKVAH